MYGYATRNFWSRDLKSWHVIWKQLTNTTLDGQFGFENFGPTYDHCKNCRESEIADKLTKTKVPLDCIFYHPQLYR